MTSLLALRDALRLVTAAKKAGPGPEYRLGLVCSFTPLHLETFAAAYVLERRSAASVPVETGIYGDLPGGLSQVAGARPNGSVVVVEWPDLDPRLGWREAVGATFAAIDDVCDTARRRLGRVAGRVEALGASCPVALVLPTLGLPPVYRGRRDRLGAVEARLQVLLAEFADRLASAPGVSIAPGIDAGGAARDAPRRDLTSDIRSGFPYSVDHASAVARAAIDALLPAPVKKGLITDLDDTLWRGLVGEIGADKVAWDLDSGAHVHALYQQLLSRLAERGTLVGVASKNDPSVVDQALRRSDLVVDPGGIFPIAVSWRPKSVSIGEILSSWNIAASDVVFVDDDPMELAQVTAHFPDITTRQFPAHDPGAVEDLLSELTDMFWKDSVSAEDTIRRATLQSAVDVEVARTTADDEPAFLRDLAARITIETDPSVHQARALELVNKTNQFNLNGRRLDEAQWAALVAGPGAFVWAVSYEDRFGPLGMISVLAGTKVEGTVTVSCWVQSCRAFSRAIEHHVLRVLSEGDEVDEILLDFVPTDRNSVIASLIGNISSGTSGDLVRLDRDVVEASLVSRIHEVELSPQRATRGNTDG